jgi:hypothetical protein
MIPFWLLGIKGGSCRQQDDFVSIVLFLQNKASTLEGDQKAARKNEGKKEDTRCMPLMEETLAVMEQEENAKRHLENCRCLLSLSIVSKYTVTYISFVLSQCLMG